MDRHRKKDKNKGEKRKIQTNPRRLLFLLKYPINQLPTNQLPSIGNVLRYIQFIKSSKALKFKSTKPFVACPQSFPGKDLICKGRSCKDPNHKCVTSLVMDVWNKAGFGELIISGAAVRDKILKLHIKYCKIIHLRDLNWDSSIGRFTKIQEEFIKESSKLLDISVGKFEEKIQSDRLRSQKAKAEDIQFFLDQKEDRKMYITTEVDKEFEKAVKNRQDRWQRMKNMKITEVKKRQKTRELVLSELEASFESDAGSSASESEAVISTDEDSVNELLQNSDSTVKGKIMISISSEDLVDCTSEVSARYRVGIRPQTALIAAICNKAGVNLEDVPISRSSVHRKRFKKIKDLGDKIRQDIMETLKGKRLVLHFDGKQIKEMEENLNITVTVERIAISVTSPDIEDTNDILLGVVQAESSKGIDQADVILNLLEYYDIVDQIFAICCDTTASNTGVYFGAITILTNILNIPLLWFLCRRHMLELHISHFMEALTGEKTKGPRRALYVRLQKTWPHIKEEVDKMEEIIRFDWNELQVGSSLYKIAREALEFGKRALTIETFNRGDYKKLCELVVFYLGGDVPGFHFYQPGACHEARFMADALYLLTLRMTEKVAQVMNEEEKKMVKTAAFFVSVCYGPWFLKSCMVDKSTSNDLAAFKSSFDIRDHYPKLGQALLYSMQRHAWYLTEQLVILSLADDDIDDKVKKKMLEKLVKCDVPDQFHMGKPKLPVIIRSTELTELVGSQSWILFKVCEIPVEEVEKWISGDASQTFDIFKRFLKSIKCVNDCAERNIRLIQDFVGGYRSDNMKQNLMLVARDNRKKLKKDLTKKQLKKI